MEIDLIREFQSIGYPQDDFKGKAVAKVNVESVMTAS